MTVGVPKFGRLQDDNYTTPPWAIDAIMPVVKRLCRVRWPKILDPGAGSGNIGRALRLAYGGKARIVGVEKRKVRRIRSRAPYTVYYDKTDFLDWHAGIRFNQFDLAMMNPPYRDAEEFVRHALELSSRTVAILRLDFLASQGRADWFREWPPDVYVLPKRPSFVKGGGTGWYSYGWFVWRRGGAWRPGRIAWLKVGP